MAQCSICTRVSEHPIADAIERSIPCPTCGHRMDIRHATIDAVERRGDIGGIAEAERTDNAGRRDGTPSDPVI